MSEQMSHVMSFTQRLHAERLERDASSSRLEIDLQIGPQIDPQTLYARIHELACGDDTVVQSLIRLLIDSDRAALAALRTAFRACAWSAAADAVHRIAGSPRMLDCANLVALLSRFEALVREHDIEQARAEFAAVVESIERLSLSLQALLDGSAR